MKFEDITEASGMSEALRDFWATGATIVDVEGDGLLDIVVCGFGDGEQIV